MNKGFVSTFLLAFVFAFSLAGAIGVAMRATSSVREDRVYTNRSQAIYSANACAEYALELINDGSTSGSGSLSIGTISCTYSISDTGSGSFAVSSAGTYNSITRHTSVLVGSINPVSISDWNISDS